MNSYFNEDYGKLYIVATPIGNSKDMSPRGIDILTNADIVAAEDTRRSMILFNKLGIRNKLISNHKFNEHGKAGYFVDEMKAGKNVAVITDAGTPCISDPGNELIKSAIENGIEVIGIPGCCAAVTALSISGFELRNFAFYGFMPRENADKKKMFAEISKNNSIRTYVFYESPMRIMTAIEYMTQNEIPCNICLCNDLTKLYEHSFRGRPAEVQDQLLAKGNYDKGEFVLVVEFDEEFFVQKEEHTVSAEALLVDVMLQNECGIKDAVDTVLASDGNTYSKNELKRAGLNLKNMFAN